MRSNMKFTLAFGFVSIPCDLFTATDDLKVKFHQFHDKCSTRLKQAGMFCPTCAEPVEKDHIVKGYGEEGEPIVLVTKSDLESLAAAKDTTLSVTQCLPLASIDPIYFEKTYYVGSDKKAGKAAAHAYALFAEALAHNHLIALGTLVYRDKENIALVRASQGRLCLSLMYFADELRAITDIPVDPAELKPEEMSLALQLIDTLKTDTFTPTAFTDAYRERTLAMIEAKRTGESYTPETEQAQAPIIDLMAALKASLKKAA